ncbi:MAG: glycosyltransferase family 9 protein, partial [Phycisphaerae bacterium]|nr:glycosyltransferase family 9 protein [Phycisphaerae bacterium]
MIPLPAEPERILLIKPSALGDVVHTLPILRLLRARFARAHIAWLINEPFANLLEGNPHLNEAIPFPRARFARSCSHPGSAVDLWHFLHSIRRREFDLALDLQGLFRSAWLGWISRAPIRVGFGNAREMAPLLYTHRVPVRQTGVHAIERYLTMIAALGCDTEPIEFDFGISLTDRQVIAERLAQRGITPATRLAVLLPGTNWPTKRWPV